MIDSTELEIERKLKHTRAGAGRPFANPELAALAHKLDKVHFFSALTEDENRAVHNACIQCRKNLYKWPSGGLWTTKFSLGSEQRVMGQSQNAEKVVRFADMFRLRFWKYRQRRCRAPYDSEYLISKERATRDLNTEREAVELLDEIEKCLLSQGLIKLPGEAQQKNKEAAKNRVQLAKMRWANLDKELGELKTRLNTVIQTLDTRLDGIAGMLKLVDKKLDENKFPSHFTSFSTNVEQPGFVKQTTTLTPGETTCSTPGKPVQ